MRKKNLSLLNSIKNGSPGIRFLYYKEGGLILLLKAVPNIRREMKAFH